MLTDKEIKELISLKKISISSYDAQNVRAGKYIVRLGQYILLPKPNSYIYDLDNPIKQPQYEKQSILRKPFVLMPGQFILGQTLELIGLSSDIGAFLDGSTTLARLGVAIHLSSFFIPPGQRAHVITLEIYNSGPWKVKLSYNIQIGKLIFFRYSHDNVFPSTISNGYYGQSEVTPAILRKGNR